MNEGRKQSFEEHIERIAETAGGVVTFCAIDLVGGETLERDAQRPMHAASAIKVMHLLELMCRVVEGTEDLETRVAWNPKPAFEYGKGSGVLQYFRPGAELTLWDLAMLTIIVSDNDATRILYDRFGPESLDLRAESFGVQTTFREVPKWGLGGKVTPENMARLMAEIGRPRVIPQQAADLCIEVLKHQQYQNCLPRYFPEFNYGGDPAKEFVIAYKSGYSGAVRTDIGVCFSTEATWSIAAMIDESPDSPYGCPTDWPGGIAIARISRLVHDYFRGRPLVDPLTLGPAEPQFRTKFSM